MAKTWLFGVYYGKLVTAGEDYISNFWKKLAKLRESPFLERYHLREFLVPHFFFIKPALCARQLEPSSFKPEDYGLSSVAYSAVLDKGESGGLKIPAKGTADGNWFRIDDVPESILSSVKDLKEKICALSLVDRSFGTSRTGTFFRYEVEGCSMRMRPIVCGSSYLVGKGILIGAWPELVSRWTGGMNLQDYEKEKKCPLNVGSSSFTRQTSGIEGVSPERTGRRSVFKGSGMRFYITYRGLGTDLRLDMPAVFLLLKDVHGFELLARNLGKSIDKTAPHIKGIVMRNVLADGHMVDYVDIDLHKTIGFDEKSGEPDMRAKDAFSILYLCAAVSECGEEGMRKLLDGIKIGSKEREKILPKYDLLRDEFLKNLGRGNLQHFAILRNPGALLPYFE